MGLLWFEGFGTIDNEIIKEIAKEHKLPIEVVAEHYKKMLEEIKGDKDEK